MKKEKRIVYKAGVTRTPSDFLCKEGELAECINLTTDTEELKVVPPLERKYVSGSALTVSEGALIAVHKLPGGGENYIYRRAYSPGYTIGWKGKATGYHAGYIGTVLDGRRVSVIGKTLIVGGETGLRYFIWNGSGYDYYEGLPEPDVQLLLYNRGEWAYDHRGGDDNGIAIRDVSQQEWNDHVVGLYATAKKKLTQNGYFCRPFMACFALKLIDGSYTKVSAPMMFFPSATVGAYFHMEVDYRGTMWCHIWDTILSAGELWYKMGDLSQFSDLIQSVSLFVSREVELYDTQQDCSRDMEYNVTGRKGTDHISSSSATDSGLMVYGSSTLPVNYDPNETTSESMVTNHMIRPLAKRDVSAVGRELSEMSVFYHVADLGLTGGSWRSILSVMDEYALENLTTRKQLTLDYYSHTNLSADVLYSYNSRLNLAGVSRSFFDGFSQFIGYDGAYQTYIAYVRIKAADGTRIVKKQYNTKQLQGIWFFYPDPRADWVTIYNLLGTVILDAALTEHPGLNGAYYFYRMPTGSSDTPARSTVGTLNGTDTTPEQLQNQIVTSEVDNPMVFRAEGYNSVGNGTVLAMATQTVALSQGQSGSFPLVVFTDEGLWAMDVDDTGLFRTVRPLPREVLTDGSAVLEVDNAIFFVSRKGLMALEGSRVTCVSARMNGPVVRAASFAGVSGSDWGSLVSACDDSATFLDYLNGCFLAYDYMDSRVLIVNPSKSYVWVFSMKDGSLSKMVTGLSLSRAVRSYPDYLLQTSGGSIYSLYDKTEEMKISSRTMGFLLTRPMKMAGPTEVVSLRELANVGWWDEEAGSSVKTVVYVSDNLKDWHQSHSRFGAAAKYYRFGLFINMLPTERLSGTIVMEQPRRTDNQRV